MRVLQKTIQSHAMKATFLQHLNTLVMEPVPEKPSLPIHASLPSAQRISTMILVQKENSNNGIYEAK
jgi:hypothetical protein